MPLRLRDLRAVACAIALAASFSSGPAFAQGAAHAPTASDRDRARGLVLEGDKRLAANDVKGALEAYRAADAIMGVPSTRIEVAKTQALLGQLIEARDTALSIGKIPQGKHEPQPFVDARAQALTIASQLEARIPAVVIKVDAPNGVEPRVALDGVDLPAASFGAAHKANPGSHTIVASAVGTANQTATIALAEGETKEIALHLVVDRAAAAPPPIVEEKPRRSYRLAFIGFGIGAAGLAVGGVTGAMSLSKASAAKKGCAGTVCPTANKSDASSSLTLATVSDIGFGVGAAGVGLGVYGLITAKAAPSAPPQAGRSAPTTNTNVGFVVGPASATFMGTF